MPRFYHRRFGSLGAAPASATPPQIADLPLVALESTRYPVYPNVPAQIAAQQGRPLPIGMPQRMMFSRWKNSPTQPQWGQEAQGYITAMDSRGQYSGAILSHAGVPPVMTSPAMAASELGATQLPTETISAEIDRPAIAKGYLPPSEYVTADQLRAFMDNDRASRIMAEQDANLRASQAMQQAKAVRSAVMDRVSASRTARNPWR